MGHSGKTHRENYSGTARKEVSASCGGSYGLMRPDYRYSAPVSYGPTSPEYDMHVEETVDGEEDDHLDMFTEEAAAGFPNSVEGGLEVIEDDIDPAGDEWDPMLAEEVVMEAANEYRRGLVDYDSE